MSKKGDKMQSWQIFSFARKHLSASTLYAIFGKKKARAIDYWCEDPLYTAKPEGAYDPIQGVKHLLSNLDDLSHFGVVRATLAYLAEGTCAETDQEQQIQEPLSTLTAEILADFRAVADMQRAIESRQPVDEVEEMMIDAVAELERTVAKYRQEMQ